MLLLLLPVLLTAPPWGDVALRIDAANQTPPAGVHIETGAYSDGPAWAFDGGRGIPVAAALDRRSSTIYLDYVALGTTTLAGVFDFGGTLELRSYAWAPRAKSILYACGSAAGEARANYHDAGARRVVVLRCGPEGVAATISGESFALPACAAGTSPSGVLGALNTAGLYGSKMLLREFAAWTRILSVAEVAELTSHSAARTAAAVPLDKQLVVVTGDSLSAGSGSTDQEKHRWTFHTEAATRHLGVRIVNQSLGGQSIWALNASAPTVDDPWAIGRSSKPPMLALATGTNDIGASGDVRAAAVIARVQAARAAGFGKALVSTSFPSAWTEAIPACETSRTVGNALLRAAATQHAYTLVELDVPEFQPTTGPLRQFDGIHLSPAGQVRQAEIWSAAIQTALGTTPRRWRLQVSDDDGATWTTTGSGFGNGP